MKTGRFLSCLSALWFFGVTVHGQESDLAAASRILLSHYIDPAAVQVLPGDQLSTLLGRLHGGASLLHDSVLMPAKPDLNTLLPGNIAYWHIPTFTPLSPDSAIMTTLKQQLKQKPAGLVLDFRGNQADADFSAAAALASLFLPPNQVIFSLKGSVNQVYRSSSGSIYHGPLIILVNGQTSGVAEALTDCLRSHGALVLGRPTAGSAALFQKRPLPSGQILRFVVGTVEIPGQAPLLGHPLQPDVVLERDAQEVAALQLIEHHQVVEVIQEAEGHRNMNEAALVRQENPEYDNYLPAKASSPAPSPVQDRDLIRALDTLKAIQATQAGATLVQTP